MRFRPCRIVATSQTRIRETAAALLAHSRYARRRLGVGSLHLGNPARAQIALCQRTQICSSKMTQELWIGFSVDVANEYLDHNLHFRPVRPFGQDFSSDCGFSMSPPATTGKSSLLTTIRVTTLTPWSGATPSICRYDCCGNLVPESHMQQTSPSRKREVTFFSGRTTTFWWTADG